MPTIAAYGPGRFHPAFKQFRFHLLQDGTVSIEVLFLVAPRCEQVLNILGVDPVFGTVRLLNALTLRRTKILEHTHFAVNHYAMGHHARVHDNLLCGMRPLLGKHQLAAGAASACLQFIERTVAGDLVDAPLSLEQRGCGS